MQLKLGPLTGNSALLVAQYLLRSADTHAGAGDPAYAMFTSPSTNPVSLSTVGFIMNAVVPNHLRLAGGKIGAELAWAPTEWRPTTWFRVTPRVGVSVDQDDHPIYLNATGLAGLRVACVPGLDLFWFQGGWGTGFHGPFTNTRGVTEFPWTPGGPELAISFVDKLRIGVRAENIFAWNGFSRETFTSGPEVSTFIDVLDFNGLLYWLPQVIAEIPRGQ